MQNKIHYLIKMGSKYVLIGVFAQCLFYNLIFADRSKAQVQSIEEVTVDVKLDNASFKEFITQVERQTNFTFFYKTKETGKIEKLNLKANNKKLADVLRDVSQMTGLSFKQVNYNIGVFQNKKKGESLDVPEVDYVMQTVMITGTVTSSEDSSPLPGVNIVEKGTNNGTITDIDGSYTITVAENSTLMFSYVGYISEEISANDRSVINVALIPDIQSLSEIVVVGYGTQKKKDLTGSITHLNMEEKDMVATTSLVQSLQGLTPGLNATMGSGAGATGGISIRGKTSLSANDDPLIVVDGMIFYGNLAELNMNDIASIDVLKDASAAAVYGSRSANGVIAVTTKKGTSEKPRFNFNMYYGVQDLANTERTNVMNADQYATRMVDYYYQQDLYDWYKINPTSDVDRPVRPDVTDRQLVANSLRTDEERENYLNGYEVDWVDEVLRTGQTQSYNLSVSGKSDKTNYYVSGSYTNEEGILKNDNFERITFLSKIESQITNWFTLEFDPQFTHRDYSGVGASLGYALQASPLGNMYDENGQYPVYIAGESYNYHPLGNLLIDDEDIRDNIRLAFKGKFEIPQIEGLKYEINYQKNYYFSHNYRYYPTTVADGSKVDGYGYKDTSTSGKSLINNLITYNKGFGDHRFNVTLLHSEEQLNGEGTLAEGTGFTSNKLGYHSLESAETQETSTSAYEEITRSFMGRISYSFKDRYLLTGTFRRDGYSAFGNNKKWADFPSLSLGWVASDEVFLSDVDVLNYLKLRVSYGVNGNQGIGRYNSQAIMNTVSTVFDGSTAIGIYSGSLGNDELGWETTLTGNIGLDFEVLDSRIRGSVDVYKSTTSDVLVQRSIPRMSGNSSVWTNIGGIKNHGVEVSLNSSNIKGGDFTWNTGVTFALNRNEITELYDDVTEDMGNGWFVGESLDAIYGYETDGVWQESDLFNGTITDGFYPGHFKIINQNPDEDDQITAEGDRKIVGNSSPNYRFSISNELKYKNLSLSVFINSIQGGNGYYIGSNNGSLIAGSTDDAYRLNRTAIRDYWRPDNAVNNAPGIYYNPKIAPAIYQDKSFVRLQDVTLAYQFTGKSIQRLGLENPKIYVSGRNLYTWTKWSGWDPDVNNYVMRSVVVGLNVNF